MKQFIKLSILIFIITTIGLAIGHVVLSKAALTFPCTSLGGHTLVGSLPCGENPAKTLYMMFVEWTNGYGLQELLWMLTVPAALFSGLSVMIYQPINTFKVFIRGFVDLLQIFIVHLGIVYFVLKAHATTVFTCPALLKGLETCTPTAANTLYLLYYNLMMGYSLIPFVIYVLSCSIIVAGVLSLINKGK